VNLVGIDIGYSNLKIASGVRDKKPKVAMRPAGAAPSDRIGQRVDGSTDRSPVSAASAVP